MIWKTTLLAAAICGSLTTPAFANATADHPNRVVFVQAVETADLNLASPKGRAALEIRIRTAARHVCGVGESRDMRAASNASACFDVALSNARNQMATMLKKAGQDVAALNEDLR